MRNSDSTRKLAAEGSSGVETHLENIMELIPCVRYLHIINTNMNGLLEI